MISLLFSYYFPSCSRLFPYFFPMCFLFCFITYLLFPSYFPIFALLFPYNFLILHYYCPKCLPGFQNDNLRHLEWPCFDGHAQCFKPAKIHISFFTPKILDFTVFGWHFPKKTTIETQKWWPFQIILTFLFIHLLSFRRSCYMYETCKNTHKLTCNTFAAPKSGSNCLCKI